MARRCFRTIFKKDLIDPELAEITFQHLQANIPWEQGIPTRSGAFTRLGYSIENIYDQPLVLELVKNGLSYFYPKRESIEVYGAYLNYYVDGKMWTPNHSHRGTKQMVISLGFPRTLKVGNKSYQMENGSGILFGSSSHGVPVEPEAGPRISIAVFLND